MRSSHEFPEKFPISNLLSISTQGTNDFSFLHDESGVLLNCGKRSLPMINTKLQNRLHNLQSQSQSPATRHKYIKNIDKKILQTVRKLSPPSKDNNLQNQFVTNTYVCPTVTHVQDNTNDLK